MFDEPNDRDLYECDLFPYPPEWAAESGIEGVALSGGLVLGEVTK